LANAILPCAAARTGRLLWTFDTIPRPGGNTGVWTQITADAELGLVYLPMETPTSGFYGHRPGNNLFAESLVAVDAKTGPGSHDCRRHALPECRLRRPPRSTGQRPARLRSEVNTGFSRSL